MPSRDRTRRDPTLAEYVCLALVVEGHTHGWAIGALLAPDGEVGRVWSLSRPLTYRAIDHLVGEGLVLRTGSAPGRGRDRRTLAPSPAGRRAARRWLDTPVRHIRDVRTELMVKLVLRERASLPLSPLLDAQEEALAETIDGLTTRHSADLVDLWRKENARAVSRFLAAARRAHPDGPRPR